MKKTLSCIGLAVAGSLLLISSCMPPPMYCGDPAGISYHQDLGHFITPDDLTGRWYVVGTTMEPNGSTWANGQCPQQYFKPLESQPGQATFEENGTWINPTGSFTGINTMIDLNTPYQMLFTKPDAGSLGELLETPWKMIARGSEPVDYLALYFCRSFSDGSTLPVLQGMDILTRTQDPALIAEIEQKVLSSAQAQGVFIDNYLQKSRNGCAEITDFATN